MNTFKLKIVASDKVFFDGDCRQLVLPIADDGLYGFLDNVANVVCISAELPENIDKRRAQEAKERAEEKLRQKQSIYEYNQSMADLSRAMERLKVKNRHEI